MDEIRELPTERLETEAVTLAGRMAAELCRFLLVLAELDRREAWKAWGCRSVVQWLSWRCGLSRSTAHEHVRVAHALRARPEVTAAFAAGQLSYSKVRAITRLPPADDETELVELARTTTAAQLDRIVSATLVASREPGVVGRRLVLTERDDHGEVHARLLPEQHGVVEAAITAAVERLPVDESSAEAPRYVVWASLMSSLPTTRYAMAMRLSKVR